MYQYQDVWEELLTRLQPESKSLHESFNQAVTALDALNDEGVISDDDFAQRMCQMVDAVTTSPLDSMMTEFVFHPASGRWAARRSTLLPETRGSGRFIRR